MVTALLEREAPEEIAAEIVALEHRLAAQDAVSLAEVRALERRAEAHRSGPHYQLAQRVRKLALRLGHVDTTRWEQLKQTPMPAFTMGERSYIGLLGSTKDAPVEVKIVFDHLFLTTNYRATIGPYDLVKITHRFNREGRIDLIDARLKQTKRLYEPSGDALPTEDSIFHLLQTFAFKDKATELEWTESRCEYFIRLRQIAAVFYDLGLKQEEQQYRFLIRAGHQLMKELDRGIQSGTLRDARVTRLPFYPFHQLAEDQAAGYIVSRAALVEPRVAFEHGPKGGHLGDLRIKYFSA